METIEYIKIRELCESLEKKIDSLQPIADSEEPTCSLEIKDIAIALSKAQGEMTVADLNKNNPYFKTRYADLRSVVDASRPSLSKYGLSVTQQIIHKNDGQSILLTKLLHLSGQWLASRMRIVPAKNDIQTISSYTTYLKRMAYASLICVVTGDEDDDGESAVATSRDLRAKGVAINTKYDPQNTSPAVITKEQLEELEYELAEYPDIAEDILDKLRLQSLADLPKNKFMVSIGRIREIKHLRNGTAHK